ALFVTPPLIVDVTGEVAPGAVVAKREVIRKITTSWERNLYLDVRYQPRGATEPEITALAVDVSTYDRFRVGDETEVRYTPHPLLRRLSPIGFTRMEDQSSLAALVARFGSSMSVWLAGVVLWFVLWFVWSKLRSSLLMWVLVLSGIAGILFSISDWPEPTPGDLISGSATIRNIRRVDVILEGRRRSDTEAIQPYDIVELSFVPPGRADPVVAVDMLDAESVPNLAEEVTVPIRYSAQNPRWAQIEGGSRTFYWKNLLFIVAIVLGLLGIVVVSWLFNRSRRRRRAARIPLP
ncbi:MAG: hypothetical protein JOZ51_08785, partial [Chloroflexi bacterium]|nr:hypothetical protein [Chloroflexota bacterium]